MFGVGWIHVRRIAKVWRQVARTVASDCGNRCRGGARRRHRLPQVHDKRRPAHRAFRHSRKARCCWSCPSEIRNSTFTTLMAKSHRLACRPGGPGFATPTGVFSVLEKNVSHQSNIYSGAEMPYMQRITWSGIALHAGVVPGFRASHGCIRLPYSFSQNTLRHDQAWQSRHCDRG